MLVARERSTWGGEPGFDLSECSDNKYNDWISADSGGRLRLGLLGAPDLAAGAARRDAEPSHRGDGVRRDVRRRTRKLRWLMRIRRCAAPALQQIPPDSGAAKAVVAGGSRRRCERRRRDPPALTTECRRRPR
jgi:hypothetical protein